jgi:uncharacterized membrane protein (UPF0182 family)
MPTPQRPQSVEFKPPSKKAIIILISLVVLFFVGSSIRSIATFYTDSLLFSSVNQSNTFSVLIRSQLFVPIVAFVIMTFATALMIFLAFHYGKKNSFIQHFDEWVVPLAQAIRKKPGLVRSLAALFVGGLFAASTAGFYKEWILFSNSQTVGTKDPQFKKDIGFYLFELPFIRLLAGWVFGGIVVLLIVSAIAHYLNGGIALEKSRRHISTSAKIHLSILCALAGFAKAVQYYFDRFAYVHSTRGAVDGATYTDINASLPANRFLIFVAIIASILFLVNVYRKGIVLPLVAIALWMIVVLIVGTLYPLIVQNFVVKPSRNTKEKPYAERNIKATRAAYGLDTVEKTDVDFQQGITDDNIAEVKAALKSPLLWDEFSLAPWIQQKRGEQIYEFTVADRDRYKVGDEVIPAFVAAREIIAPDQLPDKSWPSRHATYSHGFGAAIASSDRVIDGNEPDYLVSDLPNNDTENSVEALSLNTNKARLYFGEGLEQFVFVGSNKAEQTPLDDDISLDDLGGVQVSNSVRKAAFALRFWDYNILIADTVTDKSKIIYERDPATRVKKIAPFLDIDSNPYPVVSDGEVIWVVDAYTSSDQYPYAQYLDTENLNAGNSLSKRINYARNAVKATVNGRTGDVELYIVDDKDPIIKAYDEAFPKLFKDVKDAPKEIVEHFRYPEDLFNVQTEIYSDYHVTDPLVLLEGSSRLQVAPSTLEDITTTNTLIPSTTVQGGRADRTQSTGIPLPPLYQYLAHTDMESPEFLLTRGFVPIRSSFKMESFLSVSSDGENYGKMRVLNFRADADSSALSPTQMQGQINADKEFSQERTLLGQRGSQVIYGSLQMIPVADTVVYVQPIYVQGESRDARPILTFVTVSVSGRTVCAPTIDQAIDALRAGTTLCVPFTENVFPTTGVAPVTDEEVVDEPDSDPTSSTTTTTAPRGVSDLASLSEAELIDALARASVDYEGAKSPLDLGALQDAADRMVKIVDELNSR